MAGGKRVRYRRRSKVHPRQDRKGIHTSECPQKWLQREWHCKHMYFFCGEFSFVFLIETDVSLFSIKVAALYAALTAGLPRHISLCLC